MLNLNFYESPALNLGVKNTPGTTKFVGLNLTRNFFFKLEVFFSKNGPLFVCLRLVGLVATL